MRQNPYYILRELAGVPYLLPYGQLIADHKRGMKINGTGSYFWNLLSTEHSMSEVLSCGQQFFSIDDEDYPAFREDTVQFLNHLLNLGILIDDARTPSASGSDEKYLSIAGIHLKLMGNREIFPKEFDAFCCAENNETHQTIEFHVGIPAAYYRGELLLQNDELTVVELDEEYAISFPTSPHLLKLRLSKDGSHALFYCLPPYNDEYNSAIFHAMRLVFLYLAQRRGMVALHSASILYRDKAWLFSATSGTGKTTHTNLWKKLINAPALNGDLNLLALQDNEPVVYGIPWCGTSETFTTRTYPLGGIILLKRATVDSITELTPDQKELRVNLRLISPSWTAELFDYNLQITQAIVEKICVCQLNCTMEDSAMTTMKDWIDEQLSM